LICFGGLQKVNGEMNLIMFCYNFLRTKNILGFDKMLQAIQNWQPDYTKVVCTSKGGFSISTYKQNTAPHFLHSPQFIFEEAA
jgi:hypothetical protein